jgi:hypothetical protein
MNLFKQVRNFGRFFTPKKGNNKAVHFKTLTQEQLAEEGLALKDGLDNLPA